MELVHCIRFEPPSLPLCLLHPLFFFLSSSPFILPCLKLLLSLSSPSSLLSAAFACWCPPCLALFLSHWWLRLTVSMVTGRVKQLSSALEASQHFFLRPHSSLLPYTQTHPHPPHCKHHISFSSFLPQLFSLSHRRGMICIYMRAVKNECIAF